MATRVPELEAKHGFYGLLNVHHSASDDDIRRAYKKRALVLSLAQIHSIAETSSICILY